MANNSYHKLIESHVLAVRLPYRPYKRLEVKIEIM
nr:MAG TPA: hypothetical protein [Caudoviricetes sp.]